MTACRRRLEGPSLFLSLVLVATCQAAQRVELEVDPRVAKADPAVERAMSFITQAASMGAPGHALADQGFSLLGREDLKRPQRAGVVECQPAAGPPSALDTIVAMARDHRIVIVNESHAHAVHRLLTLHLVEKLAPLGFKYFAAEAYFFGENSTYAEYAPARYPKEEHGFYTKEATFGRMTRAALAHGYRLVMYDDMKPVIAPAAEQISNREENEAENLVARIFSRDPEAKVLIHVGASHAMETPDQRGDTWMAARLAAKTGLDPLTINQTGCRGAVDEFRLATMGSNPGFDLRVIHAATPTFERGRPVWRRLMGDIATDIPSELLPVEGWSIIEARRIDEPDDAIPFDRVAIRPGDEVALMLPPGKYRVRASRLQ